MRRQTDSDKVRPPTNRYQSSRVRSRIRRWLLLYWPSRSRAWLYRLPFYFLAAFVIPLLSLAALGAYVGPDRTLAGVPAVLFIAVLAVVVRTYAVRADATLAKAEAPDTWHRISEAWPFPLEDPPPRRLVYGFMVSATGMALILIGLCGGGLALNGLVCPILLSSGAVTELKEAPPLPLMIALGISAIVVGVPINVVAIGTGARLRDRGRRLRARDARSLLQRPGERPVLLLRSFDDEELVDPRPVSLFQRRYEENLSRALKQLGPVITVGRPCDSVGFAGAARFYVSQDNWQLAIRYLMTHAAAVVVVAGRTEGLWWEIGTAYECVRREHLLFFFPLVVAGPRDPSLVAGYKEFVARWNLTGKRYKRMEAERQARYQLFRQRSTPYLRETLPVDLKDAFFLDFLPDGQVRVLRSRYGFLRNYMVGLVPRFHRLRFDMTRTLWPFMAKLYQLV